MSDNERSVTVEPLRYAKLGLLHCGVTRNGRVSVAGQVADLRDGASVRFERSGVSVTRRGDEYVFSRD